ncbi:MAG: YtxH domain-containing protein [Chitinophagaceae bacterium]|nr:MAG: YtxH domain-containing protein [Chitinophagaceae bacterium]
MPRIFLVLTGIVIGMLIAPAKGSDTRARLSKFLGPLMDDPEELAEAAAHALQARRDQIHTGVNQLADGSEAF